MQRTNDLEQISNPASIHSQQSMRLSVRPSGDPQNQPDGRASPSYDYEDDEDFPEGGTRAWLVVVGAWCAMFSSMGLLNTVGSIQAWVAEHQLQEYSESSIGWIFGVYAFLLYIGGAQVGPIFDAHDVRFVIVPGSIGVVVAIMCLSVSQGAYSISILRYFMLTPSFRILPNFSIIRSPRWPFSLSSLHASSVCSWALVLQATCPCNWCSMHRWRSRRCLLSAHYALPGS